MLIKRLLFSDNQKQQPPKKSFKEKAAKLGKDIKDYYNEHGAVNTAKKGAEIAWNYAKKHPDDVAIEAGSYLVLPYATNAVLKKAVKNPALRATIASSTAILPVGETIIAAKVAHRLKKQEKLKEQQRNNKE